MPGDFIVFWCCVQRIGKAVNNIIFLQRLFMFCSDGDRGKKDQLDVNMY